MSPSDLELLGYVLQLGVFTLAAIFGLHVADV